MQMFKTNTARSAIIGIYTLLLVSFVVIGLYIGRVILMPLALAILLAFLLSPLVSRFERVVGRILAVILVVMLVTIAIGFTGYVLSRELVRFASNLPAYKTNIDTKIYSLEQYKSFFNKSFDTLNELKSKFSNNQPYSSANKNELLNINQILLKIIEEIFGSFINILSSTFLVVLLVGFILIDKEDLRGRIIRLMGQGRIGSTTHAIDDASKRVSRYLWMLLFVNILAGIAVVIGLYFLGVPNALLWGALTTILRFIPYVGSWIAASVPIALSFAISTSWLIPFFTISLFIFIDAFCFNILEPLLYGNSTGVSPIALIIAALFWTLLWGPVGLILSTPLTACLVVLGHYVPKLEFFNVLVSDEKPLALHEEYYHSLLVSNINELIQLTDNYLKDNSLTSLYDTVLIPVIAAGEIDSHKEILDDEQIHTLRQNIADMIEDISARPIVHSQVTLSQEPLSSAAEVNNELKSLHSTITILCIPVKAKRDELVGEMLTQLLKEDFFNVLNVSSELKIEDILEFIKSNNPKIIIISVAPPSTIIQARYLSRKIRTNFPKLNIIVGLWGYTENLSEVTEGLHASGTNVVVTTLADALLQVNQANNNIA